MFDTGQVCAISLRFVFSPLLCFHTVITKIPLDDGKNLIIYGYFCCYKPKPLLQQQPYNLHRTIILSVRVEFH